MTRFYQSEITLHGRPGGKAVTPVDITRYRLSARYKDAINEETRSGQITLRSQFGRFNSLGPLLTIKDAWKDYLVKVVLTQGAKTNTFVFEIASTSSQTARMGNHVTLTLVEPAVRIEESLDSSRLLLVSPWQAIKERMKSFNSEGGNQRTDVRLTGPVNADASDPVNVILDDADLKQDWLPHEPTSIKRHLTDIINRLSDPLTVGSSNEDWYYRIIPTNNTSFELQMGRLSSPATNAISVNPTKGETLTDEITTRTDNTRWKRGVVLRGQKGAHTYPMGFTRLASEVEHARLAPTFDSGTAYSVGDHVKSLVVQTLINPVTGNSDQTKSIRYFRALQASTGRTPVIGGNLHWKDLYSDPAWSLWAKKPIFDGIIEAKAAPYAGYFHDMGIVKRAYGAEAPEEKFGFVTGKDIQKRVTSKPTGGGLRGQRVMATSDGKIYEYDGAAWRPSAAPVNGDIIYDRSKSEILKYNSGWKTEWKLTDTDPAFDPGRPTPFHPVSSVDVAKDIFGMDQAVQLTFDWNIIDPANAIDDYISILSPVLGIVANVRLGLGVVITGIQDNLRDALFGLFGFTDDAAGDASLKADIKKALGNGDVRNKASRWYGFSARLSDLDANLAPNGTATFFNLNGEWNSAGAEDLGSFSHLELNMKIQHKAKNGNSVTGLANIPMIFWFRDINDRIVYHVANVRAHAVWQKLRIPVGRQSNLPLFDNRTDELFSLAGYTLPYNWWIPERELTGVEFDWDHVTEMGCFNMASYNENFLYVGGQDVWFKAFEEHLAQVANRVISYYTSGIIDLQDLVTDKVELSICNMHFRKDSYVISDDDSAKNVRYRLERMPAISDYTQMKNLARRKVARQQYYPIRTTIYCRGDVSLLAGRAFTISGSFGWPTQTSPPSIHDNVWAAMSVTHVEDGTGYHCIVDAIKPFRES